MRYLCVLLFVLSAFPIFAHESDIQHVHSADIAEVTSNLVVQGTITTDHKLGNSAVVNQTGVWQGKTYTFNPKTGVIVTRSKDDQDHGLPALEVFKIEDGKVWFKYSDSKIKDPILIKKDLKKALK